MLTYSQQPNQPPSRMWVINAYKEDSRIMELHNFCEPDPEGLGKAEISTWVGFSLLPSNQHPTNGIIFRFRQALRWTTRMH